MAASDKKPPGQTWEELREGRAQTDSADVQFLAGLQQELRNRREAIPVRGKDEVWDAIYARMDDGTAVSDAAQPETGRRSPAVMSSVPSGTAAQQPVSAQPDGSSDSVPFHPAARPRSHYRQVGWIAAAAVLVASLIGLLSYTSMAPKQQLLSGGHNTVTALTLDDGSVITLRPGASLFARGRSAANEQRYRLEGEALFEVVSNQNRVFRVETETGSVQVLGTEFLVRSTPDHMEVYLLEGRVAVSDRTAAESTQLQPGQAVRVDASGLQELAGTSWQDYALGWTTGQLVADGRSVEEVIRELEFHFGIQIRVPAGLGDETLGGTFPLDTVDLALGDLGAALGGSFREVQEGVYELTAP